MIGCTLEKQLNEPGQGKQIIQDQKPEVRNSSCKADVEKQANHRNRK